MTWRDFFNRLFGTPRRAVITLVVFAALLFSGVIGMMVAAIANALTKLLLAFVPLLAIVGLYYFLVAGRPPWKRHAKKKD